MQRISLWITAALILTVAILTLTPVPPTPTINSNDKLHHLVAFAGIILPSALWNRPVLIWLLPTAFFFGAGIELLQPLVGRSRDIMDLFANTIGIGIGALIALIAHKITRT